MIEAVVGKKIYSVWTDMLRKLVPRGRTHRLSVVLASMLQYTQQAAYEKESSNAKTGKLSEIFEASYDNYVNGDITELLELAESLLKDSKVKFRRVNSRGHGYSIAEEAVHEFLRWEDMPWER